MVAGEAGKRKATRRKGSEGRPEGALATSKKRAAKEVKIPAKNERGKVATELEHLYPGSLRRPGRHSPVGGTQRQWGLSKSRSRAPPPMSAEPARRPIGGAQRPGPRPPLEQVG